MTNILHRIFQDGRHKHFVDYLADVNCIITAISLFPQLFMLIGGQNPSGLSPLSFILIILSSCIWIVYGFHRRTPPVIISSALNTVAAAGILLIIFLKG
jgi:uncharacterized protein with PQ loop repeat